MKHGPVIFGFALRCFRSNFVNFQRRMRVYFLIIQAISQERKRRPRDSIFCLKTHEHLVCHIMLAVHIDIIGECRFDYCTPISGLTANRNYRNLMFPIRNRNINNCLGCALPSFPSPISTSFFANPFEYTN